MKRVVSVMLTVFVALAAAAENAPKSEFTRAAPGLRLAEHSDSFEKGSFAVWTGRLPLTGKLVVEFDRAAIGEGAQDTEGVAFFEPDKSSRQKLPHAVGKFYPLDPTIVYLDATPKDVLEPLLGSERTARILSGNSPRYEVAVRVVVKRYRTDVECDHRSYGLTLESISLLKPVLVALGEAKDIGC